MVTSISNTNIPGDATLVLRQIIASGTTDPISATRSTNSQFILTSYPDRPTEYPIVTIKGSIEGSEKLGTNSEGLAVKLNFEVRTWARNMKERDSVLGDVMDALRTSQKGVSSISGTESFGLEDMNFGVTVPVDEEGVEGIKSIILPVNYTFYTI